MKKAEMYSLLSMSNKAKGLYSITCFRKNLLPELNILYDLVSVRSTIHYEQKPDMRLPPNNLKLRRARNESSKRVAYVDSDADGSMKLAADGDSRTYWHTVHNQFYLVPYPREIQKSLSKEAQIKAIKYTPRQDLEEGCIAGYEIYVSKDGKTWGEAVASGTFVNSKETQTVEFTPCMGRYVKLMALSACVRDDKRAAIAELEIVTAK